jgi:predicted HTH domain antitoxin
MARRAYLDLEEELAVVTETGLYESREAFLSDAVATFFAARPDLREAVACGLYEKGLFSLGRAAEWSGLSIEEIKESLHRRGIARQSSADLAELEEMARISLASAGRTAR